MREYGLTILVAAAVTYLLTPLVRRFAIAVGAMHAGRARRQAAGFLDARP